MQVRFLEATPLIRRGKLHRTFQAGEVVELSNDSARHWIGRGLAEEIRNGASVPASKSLRTGPTPPAPPREHLKGASPAESDKKTDAFERFRRRELANPPPPPDAGKSQDSGPDKPSSASAPDPASTETTSSSSDEQEKPTDAASSPSTSSTSGRRGRTPFTRRTPASGAPTQDPSPSEG